MRKIGRLLKALCVFAATAAMAPIIAVCLPFRCAWEVLTGPSGTPGGEEK